MDKCKFKRTMLAIGLLFFTILTVGKMPAAFNAVNVLVKAAATETEKVVIRDAQKTFRENITVELGKTSTSCYAVVTPDFVTDKSVTYTSQNTGIMTVQTVAVNGRYYAYMTGVKEGVTIVTATTKSGAAYSSYVTVYTAISSTPGVINTNTALKKTALQEAGSFTKTASVNDVGTVKGRVGNYLYLDMPAGYLEKGYHIAYVETEKVTIKCTEIQLDSTSITLYVKEKRQLKRRVLPILTSNRKVTFTSSNKKVATISNKGCIRAKKQGKATIICKAADGSGISAACSVTVKQRVQRILVKKVRCTLHKGEKKQLTAKITPKTADDKSVVWSSSKEAVATVDSTGKVTAVGNGTAVITCTAQDGSGITGKSRITVESGYRLVIEDIGTLTKGDVVTAKAKLVTQEGKVVGNAKKASGQTGNRQFIWTSSNTNVATINKRTGELRAIYPGTTVITCRTADGRQIGRKTVRVVGNDTVANNIFKKLPKEKYVQFEKEKSFLLSANATGLSWSSLTPKVVQISNGVVTMKSSGYGIIQCRKNGKETKTCRLYIYQKTKQKYGIQKSNPVRGIVRQKVSVLGALGENGVVTVTGKKKNAVLYHDVLLYSTKINRDFFYENMYTIFRGTHFVNKDTLEYNEKEAIVYNLVDDTLYIHINVKFRGDAVYKRIEKAGFWGKKETGKMYKQVVVDGVENTFSLDKVDLSLTPFPKSLRLKVVTKINDVTSTQSIKSSNSKNNTSTKNKENKNYVMVQIGNYTTKAGKVIEPVIDDEKGRHYWYFSRLYFDTIDVKKSLDCCYHYSHYKSRNSTEGKKNMKTIYMPTQEMMKKNTGKYYEVITEGLYSRVIAHEMGHVLGLDDAYAYEGENIEISRASPKLKKKKLIMRDGRTYNKANSLEIVMLFYAKSQGYTQSEISWQSFHDYSIYTYKDSKEIKHYDAGMESKAIK